MLVAGDVLKRYFCILTLFVAATAFAQSADSPVDLTGADASNLRSGLGHTVILVGRLGVGKQGLSLSGTPPNDIFIYVIPDIPPSGVYSFPKTWTRFLNQQVRLTGKLRFRSFKQPKGSKVVVQIPPDYFYMVLQRTKIESVSQSDDKRDLQAEPKKD